MHTRGRSYYATLDRKRRFYGWQSSHSKRSSSCVSLDEHATKSATPTNATGLSFMTSPLDPSASHSIQLAHTARLPSYSERGRSPRRDRKLHLEDRLLERREGQLAQERMQALAELG